jgi:hypothetical protein
VREITKTINGIDIVITSGIDIEDSEIIMPTTSKPYPSWKWVINEANETYWDSPVVMPIENGVTFKWDEDSLSWVRVN